MSRISIIASNRDRFDLNTPSTQWFIKSLEHQTFKDFELVIADGGSKNLDSIQEFCKKAKIKAKVVQYKLGEKFERAKMNNVGIRNATSPYIMTTDVDMFFANKFVETLVGFLSPDTFIESRTMYWKAPLVQKIYRGLLDPFNDMESCKVGRIKKRTTAGGCQCASIDQWEKVRGFDERYVGWGSEDYDLLTRMEKSRAKVVWIGETRETIMVFHQPHAKNIKQELEEQKQNKKLLNNVRSYRVNPDGWGGIDG